MSRVSMLKGMGLVFGLAVVLTFGTVRGQGSKAGALRRQALAWLSANHADDAEWTDKVRKQVAKDIDEGNDFIFTFGPGVMKTSKPYQVHVFAGRFYTFQLTIPQIK